MIAPIALRQKCVRPARRGRKWITITSSLRSDMTAADRSMARPSFPAEIRQAASGTAFDLVTARRPFKRHPACLMSRLLDGGVAMRNIDFPRRSLARDNRAPRSEALELSEYPIRLDLADSLGVWGYEDRTSCAAA